MGSEITCMRIVEFDAGHRVARHESKCAHLHGHRYRVELHARRRGSPTDQIGRVVDFSVLKATVGAWLDEQWDHRLLLWKHDADALGWLPNGGEREVAGVRLVPFNPTAENIAQHLLAEVCPAVLPPTVQVFRVVVWETPNCCGEARLP